MTIPFYSMDINFREVVLIFKMILSGRAFKDRDIKEYEDLVVSTLGVKYVVLFPSARTGFFFLLDTLFKKGDEVILSIFSFPLFVRLMHEKGIIPIFVDVESETALINADLIEEKITQKTKGILVTHLFGNPCQMRKIVDICNKHNIYLLEDCAHAFGSQYEGRYLGTFGIASFFSTSPMKVPTTLGGGFVATNSELIYKKIHEVLCASRQYRYNFSKFFKFLTLSLIYYLNSFPTVFSILTSKVFRFLKVKNPGLLRRIFYSELISKKPFDPFERIRFTNLQATVGISQIKRHYQMILTRRKFAKIFDSSFTNCKFIKPIKEENGRFNNYLYYIVRVENKATEYFISKAMERGLYLMREDVWHCNAYDFSKTYIQECPVADKLRNQLVRLPTSSLLSEKEIHKIAETVLDAVDK